MNFLSKHVPVPDAGKRAVAALVNIASRSRYSSYRRFAFPAVLTSQ